MYLLKNAPSAGQHGRVLQGRCSLEMGGRLVLMVGSGAVSSLEVSEGVQSSRADLGNVAWSDSSCLTCTFLALCPSNSAHLSHRKQVTREEVTLVLNFPSFNGARE